MRQILIEKNDSISQMSGDRLSFKLTGAQATHLSSGMVVNMEWPFKFRPVSGGKAEFVFRLPRHLAEQGVTLSGAYAESGTIYAVFVRHTNAEFFAGTEFLEALLVESVSFRQVDGKMVGGVLMLDKESGALEIKKDEKKSRKKKKS